MPEMALRVTGPMDQFVRHLDRPVHPVEAPWRRLDVFPDWRTIEGLAVSPDGARLAVTGDGWVSVIETGTGKRVGDYPEILDADVVSIRFSPDGRQLVLGLGDDRVLMLDAVGGSGIISDEKIPAGRLASATVVSDGSLVVAARDHEKASLWRKALSGGWEQKCFPCAPLDEVGLTSDGDLLVAERDGGVAAHDLKTGERREVWPADRRRLARLWGLNDLAQVLGEESTHLVRLSDGRSIFFTWPNRFVSAATLSPDGKWIYLSYLREGGAVYQYLVEGQSCPYLALSREKRTALLVRADNSWRALVTATYLLGMMPDVLLVEDGEGLVALTPGARGEHRLAVSWGEALEDDGWRWEISRITDIYGNTGSPIREGRETSFPAVVPAIVKALTE